MCMCVPFFLTTDDSEKERNISTTKRSFPNPALSTYAFFFAGDSLFTVLCNVISLSFFFGVAGGGGRVGGVFRLFEAEEEEEEEEREDDRREEGRGDILRE